MIVDIYKINQILSVLVYPDSECIKIIKNNKVIREIKPLVFMVLILICFL